MSTLLARRLRAGTSLLAALAGTSVACGSRSALLPGPERSEDAGAGDAPSCVRDSDCEAEPDLCAPSLCQAGQCIRRITVCSDGDPCTDDRCDPATGACLSEPATFDLDGDGFKGPRPGTVPGAADACGDDCDDTSAAAFPGGVEVCDSVDNDCNGVVDDGAGYLPPTDGPRDVRVSSESLESSENVGGLAHDGARYLATYQGTTGGKESGYGRLLARDGAFDSDETRLMQTASDAYVTGTVWTGDRFGVVWSDRRLGNYEVYFAAYDREGRKMAPGDVQISSSEGFSINPRLTWTGTEFVAVWADGQGGNGSFQIDARRIALDGSLPSATQTLVARGESPELAVGRPGLGLVYSVPSEDGLEVVFRPFDFELRGLAPARTVSSPGRDARYPALVWNADSFVVLWQERPGDFQLTGIRLDGLGEPLAGPRALTDSPGNARFGSLIPLGDRMLLVYSDDRDGGSYELYSQTLRPELTALGTATRITESDGHSLGGVATLGPEGDVAVLFTDQREGRKQTYFTRLVCDQAPPP